MSIRIKLRPGRSRVRSDQFKMFLRQGLSRQMTTISVRPIAHMLETELEVPAAQGATARRADDTAIQPNLGRWSFQVEQ